MGVKQSTLAGPSAPSPSPIFPETRPPHASRRPRILRGTGALSIQVEAPDGLDATALITDSQAALLEHLPEDEIFSLEADALTAPNVTFFVARIDGEPVGCVALVDATVYGEVKRLFVRRDGRGLGIGYELMEEVEAYCLDIGLLEIKLETSPVLTEAVRLYTAMGYAVAEPFGNYPPASSSLFMAKNLRLQLAAGVRAGR